MSDETSANKPPGDDAVALSSKKQRYVQVRGDSNTNNNNTKKNTSVGPSSLVARCRAVVVANLERYPPQVLGVLSENDWEELVQSRHRKTAPQKGTGGLDGTGRRTPALAGRFLGEVEVHNPHLAESALADVLLWKDNVEYQFTRDGLTRPRALLLPWPLLVKQIAGVADVLSAYRKKEDEAEKNGELLEVTSKDATTIIEATLALKESPMNVALLKDSGIGKVLKKLIKVSSNRRQKSIFRRLKMPVSSAAARAGDVKELSVLKQLEQLLQAWMDLAASVGVEINSSPTKKNGMAVEKFREDNDDLLRVEKCKSWRQLFASLKERAEERKLNLALKMRANRRKENSMRPQIIKVRPANPRREKILEKSSASTPTWGRGGSTVGSHGGAKIFQLRKEAAVQSTRSKSGVAAFKKPSGFGSAVAFAAKPKMTPQQRTKLQNMKSQQKMQQQQINSNRKRKAAPVVALGSGKQMAVPQRIMRMQGGTFSTKKFKK